MDVRTRVALVAGEPLIRRGCGRDTMMRNILSRNRMNPSAPPVSLLVGASSESSISSHPRIIDLALSTGTSTTSLGINVTEIILSMLIVLVFREHAQCQGDLGDNTFVYRLPGHQDVTLERGSKNVDYLDSLIIGFHPGYPKKRSLVQVDNMSSNSGYEVSMRSALTPCSMTVLEISSYPAVASLWVPGLNTSRCRFHVRGVFHIREDHTYYTVDPPRYYRNMKQLSITYDRPRLPDIIPAVSQ